MNKGIRLIKRLVALSLVLLLSIESFAAVVGDNDGAAFITKAEFDSLKNTFQSQIDQYNSSIDNKIDGAIAGYLAGIKVAKVTEQRLMLWGGKTIGLLENEESRKYQEGTVDGKIEYTSWYPYQSNNDNNPWYVSNPTGNNITGEVTPDFLAFCHHIFSAVGVPFKYCLVVPNSTTNIFDFLGYASVLDSLSASAFVSAAIDYTYAGRFLFGFCRGWIPKRFNLDFDITTSTDVLGSFCETTDGSVNSRGAGYGYKHNSANVRFEDASWSSQYTLDNTNKYLSNATADTPYRGLRDINWHGINLTNDVTEVHTSGEFAKQGWVIPETKKDNFHIKAFIKHSDLSASVSYGCYSMTWVRGISGDGSGATYSHIQDTPHGSVPTSNNFKKLYKADLGNAVTASNIYSSEIGNVISDNMPDKVTTDVFDGVSKTVAPLSIGLPIATVKENDSVKLELDFLNAADYTVAFAVGGFDTEPISNTIGTDTGCVVKGSTNHMISFTGPRTAEPITINVNKKGILFLKYSAIGNNAQQIKLPVNCVITTDS